MNAKTAKQLRQITGYRNATATPATYTSRPSRRKATIRPGAPLPVVYTVTGAFLLTACPKADYRQAKKAARA